MNVTLVEMAERILQRVAAPKTSDFIRRLHQANGVEIRESARIKLLYQTDDRGSSLIDAET